MRTQDRLSDLCLKRGKGSQQKEVRRKEEKMKAFYLSLKANTPKSGYWDQYLLSEMLEETDKIENADIVIIPGAYQFELVDNINRELSKLEKVVVIVTSDEEGKFPLHKLKHKDMRLYATYPHKTTANVRWLPIGYPPHINEKGKEAPEKTLDLFYAGQINHEDRQNMYNELIQLEVNGEIVPSKGFAQGLERKEYIQKMSEAKVVPCPRGNISPDSFRLYETMECGAVPIAEYPNFWTKIFKDAPFPIIQTKEQWRGYCQDAIYDYPRSNNKIQSWWIREKQKIRQELTGDDEVSIVIPVSPIPSHPSPEILLETIRSIRHYFKDTIYLMFDGVRKEQEGKRKDYQEFIRRVLWKNRELNIYPIIFEEHKHQVGMMREVLPILKSKLLLFVEQDTPIVTDEPIEWDKIKEFISSGQSNLVRLYHESFIHPDHKHLMLESGLFTETAQWSQRPHMSTVAFYNRLISYFSPNANGFIEDYIHGKEYEDFVIYGREGWYQWKTHIYTPKGSIKRSLHTDGRAGSQKFENTQKW